MSTGKAGQCFVTGVVFYNIQNLCFVYYKKQRSIQSNTTLPNTLVELMAERRFKKNKKYIKHSR